MYLVRSFLAGCLAMAFVFGTTDGSIRVASGSAGHCLNIIDGNKFQTPVRTHRKRSPYDPEKQPPETSSNPNDPSPSAQQFARCLPKGITGSDVVSVVFVKPVQGKAENVVSVDKKLTELKAHCKRGKLVTASGREIYFFQMAGCWGNPPENYQEIFDEQTRKLAQLRKRYTVIEMPCNPSGMLIQ
jgi:hypothetical protein